MQTFIKVVNYQHMMPTRYTLEVRRQQQDSAALHRRRVLLTTDHNMATARSCSQ